MVISFATYFLPRAVFEIKVTGPRVCFPFDPLDGATLPYLRRANRSRGTCIFRKQRGSYLEKWRSAELSRRSRQPRRMPALQTASEDFRLCPLGLKQPTQIVAMLECDAKAIAVPVALSTPVFPLHLLGALSAQAARTRASFQFCCVTTWGPILE